MKNIYERDFNKVILPNGMKWKELYKLNASHSNYSPISVGPRHYAIIDKNDLLYTAGNNNQHQYDHSIRDDSYHLTVKSFSRKDSDEKITIIPPSKIINVYCGKFTTSSVTEDGKVYVSGWGIDNHIQTSWRDTDSELRKRAIKHLWDECLDITLFDDGSISTYYGKCCMQLDAIDIEITTQKLYFNLYFIIF